MYYQDIKKYIWGLSINMLKDIVATTGPDKQIIFWNITTTDIKLRYQTYHEKQIRGISFNNSGNLLMTVG